MAVCGSMNKDISSTVCIQPHVTQDLMSILECIGYPLLATLHLVCNPWVHDYLWPDDEDVHRAHLNDMAMLEPMPLGIASIPVSPKTQIPPTLSGYYTTSVEALTGPRDNPRAIDWNAETMPASRSSPVTPFLATDEMLDVPFGHADLQTNKLQQSATPAPAPAPAPPSPPMNDRAPTSSTNSKRPSIVIRRLPAPTSRPPALEPTTTPYQRIMQSATTSAAMIAHLSWQEVKHYTDDVSLDDMARIPTTLLDELDARYIATAIVREGSLVELLEREKGEKRTKGSSLSQWSRNASEYEKRPANIELRQVSGKLVSERIRGIEGAIGDNGSYFPESPTPNILIEPMSPTRATDEELMTPLTPTIEAAAGQMFQKAAVRRQVKRDSIQDLLQESLPVERTVDVRRLQHDAAWKYIDEHVEAYVDDFADIEKAGSKTRRALWEELVGLRRKKNELGRVVNDLRKPQNCKAMM